MRYLSFVLVAVLAAVVPACDAGDPPPEIPRTTPPELKGTLSVIEAPAISTPSAKRVKPAKPAVMYGVGPVYET